MKQAKSKPRVVIVGGGFGGLASAKALKKAPVSVTLIDRSNHHLFQPLLYQVATGVLNPGQIASPIRSILRDQSNATVILGEVVGIDKRSRCVLANTEDREGLSIPYDYLVLATGGQKTYFGRDEFQKFAPSLKDLSDAVAVRNRILRSFERAEAEDDAERRRALLTFVIIGAGPTGVELAAAMALLVRRTLRSEFRRIDPGSARVLLIHAGDCVLPSFDDALSVAAKDRLEKMGVEIRLGHAVDDLDGDGVLVDGERIPSKTVIWAAGIAPSPAGAWLGAETDRAGRVRVDDCLRIREHPEIFVIGDTASADQDGEPLPGVAQVAIQQGRYVGALIERLTTGRPQPSPFRYFDKGEMAVVGKGFAVLQSGRVHMAGFIASLVWAVVHIQFLAQSNLRVSVFLQWMWTYITGKRGSRLIVNHRTSAGIILELGH